MATLEAQWMLENDPAFRGRVRSAAIRGAADRDSNAHLGVRATAYAVLQDQQSVQGAFVRVLASHNEILGNVTVVEPPPQEGTGGMIPQSPSVDISKVTDDAIVHCVNTYFGVVSNIFFTEEGTPK
jgi:hypothetical protein